jgi:hypothetical protein
MIDFTDKFSYTTGNAFTLTGTDYTGYFNTLDGVAYAGKISLSTPLSNKSNYLNDVYLSTFYFDRDITETPTLPYSLNEVKFKINEFITADSINEKLRKLNLNNQFLYSRFFIQNSDLPQVYTSTIAITGNSSELQYFTDFTGLSTTTTQQTILTTLSNSVGCEAVFDSSENNYAIFIPTSTSLTILTGSKANNTVGVATTTTFCSNQVNNVLSFSKITDADLNGNILYVADAGNKTIFKFNIEHFYNYDDSLGNDTVLIDLQSSTNVKNKLALKSPRYIATSNEHIHVYDNVTRYFKEYDFNFNTTRSARLISRKENVLGLSYNKFLDYLLVVTQRNNQIFCNLFQNYNLSLRQSVGIILGSNETILKIKFSQNDSNIFYITTSRFIYKLFVNSPSKLIGIYKDHNLKINNPPGLYTGLAVCPSVNNYDINIVSTQDRLVFCEDFSFYKDVLKETNIDNYSFNDIQINQNEYIQANYLNKELFKIASNIIRLKNQIIGKFLTRFITPNANITYQQSLLTANQELLGYTYLTDYNFLKIPTTDNLFVHENEKISYGVINRCINQIYDLQSSILDVSKPTNNTLVQYLCADGILNLS